MEIRNPAPATTLVGGEARNLARSWQVGQILQATVTAAGRDGLELQVGAARVRAESNLQLATGQRLELQVTSTGERPVLKVLNPPPDSGAAVTQQALRNALPRQAALPPLLANLLQITSPQSGLRSALPPAVVQAATQLLASLPGSESLRVPERLQQALRDSGLFLESRLAAPGAGKPVNDFKAGLLRLLQVTSAANPEPGAAARDPGTAAAPLRGSPVVPQPPVAAGLPEQPALALRELGQQLEGTLARLQLHQLASLPGEEGRGNLLYSVELPLRHGDRSDVLDLRIRGEDGAANSDEPDRWSVWLGLDLPGLGPLRALVSLYGGEVSVSFWSERDQARGALERELDGLRNRLEGAGLSVGRLASLEGRPSGETPRPATPILDTTA